MIKKIIKELVYFFTILVVLALVKHPDLLTSPLERLDLILQQGNYLHPFIWSFLVYIFIGIFRLVAKVVVYIKNKK